MTGNEALTEAKRRLRTAGIDGFARDARRLLAHALDCAPDRLSLHLHHDLQAEVFSRFKALIDRRVARAPVSHLVGGRHFFEHWFQVTPDVLDPRAETELLVEHALAMPFDRVLDLGTGSGAILLSLLAARPDATGLGTDISPAALQVAARNAEALGVSDRADWRQADWFDGVEGRFDLIVSNPPYIAADEMDGLDPEVRLYEPRAALTDEGDGLSAYRLIARDAPGRLKPGGRLAVEIGPTQAKSVTDLLRSAGLGDVAVHRDLGGRARVVTATHGKKARQTGKKPRH